ncbi:MAG TPA: hypothetical protein VN327_04965 [Pseudonocardiaceae bacterium]|nr:hypothetical protein [Pseudonocardiaceae bacterium]
MTSSWREIPGPPPTPPNGNLADIVAAGGLHMFQLDLHERYGTVARFELPDTRVVSVADPDLLAVTSRINRRPEELFEFLSPLFEAENLQTIPEQEHVPWRRLLASALGNHCSHEALAHLRETITRILDARRAGPDRPRADLVSMLAGHPEIARRVRDELDRVLGPIRNVSIPSGSPRRRPRASGPAEVRIHPVRVRSSRLRGGRAGDGRDQTHARGPAETLRVSPSAGSRGHAGRAIRAVGAR